MKNLTLSLFALSLYACTPAAETQTDVNTDVVVFSATRDWRHDSGIGGAQGFLGREADTAKADNADGFGLFITEDPRVFSDENLKKFAVIVLNNASGNILNTEQETAIQNFVERGKGLVAIHASGDSSLAGFWPWWEEQLGTEFVSHPADPQFQTADVVVLAEEHPVMAGLGPKFSHKDEWYTFTGRIVYSALGHKADAYDSEPNILLMRNMMDWARNGGNTGCP